MTYNNQAIVAFRCSDELLDRIDEIAICNDWSRAQVVRTCLSRYFASVDAADPEGGDQDA